MQSLKILFLDIDGVLNAGHYMAQMYRLWKRNPLQKSRDEFGSYFAPYCVEALDYIVKETDCKIVFSTTWRKRLGLEGMKDLWKKRRLLGEVYDVTEVLGVTRGEEIDLWLQENTVDSYCIVDDRTDFSPEQLPFFVKTDGRFGLTMEDAKRVIEILNKSK